MCHVLNDGFVNRNGKSSKLIQIHSRVCLISGWNRHRITSQVNFIHLVLKLFKSSTYENNIKLPNVLLSKVVFITVVHLFRKMPVPGFSPPLSKVITHIKDNKKHHFCLSSFLLQKRFVTGFQQGGGVIFKPY